MLTVPQLRKLVKTADTFVKGSKTTYPSGKVMEAKEYYIDDFDDTGFTVSDPETDEQFHLLYVDVLGCDSLK